MHDVGPPEDASVSRDVESGVVHFEMYDANGYCCGGADFHADGRVVWTLHSGDEVKSGTDQS